MSQQTMQPAFECWFKGNAKGYTFRSLIFPLFMKILYICNINFNSCFYVEFSYIFL